jgi:hypothetical protein
MGRPLWQILLPIGLLSLAVHRAGALVIAFEQALPTVLVAAFAWQVVAALAVALGLYLGRRWTIGAAVVLGAALVGGALLQTLASGGADLPFALSRAVGAALGAAGLAWIANESFRPPHPRGPR